MSSEPKAPIYLLSLSIFDGDAKHEVSAEFTEPDAFDLTAQILRGVQRRWSAEKVKPTFVELMVKLGEPR